MKIREHLDTASVILTIIISVLTGTLWLSSKFNELEKDIAIIKTVMVMQNIMPKELAKADNQ